MIQVRQHNNYAAQAALHGHKMEFKKVKREITEINKETKKIMVDLHKEAIRKKFEEKIRKSKAWQVNS